jgi:diaminopimelate decarboxylase
LKTEFSHPANVLRFWRSITAPLLGRVRTPFYVFSIVPIQEALAQLDQHLAHFPVRHWLSCKTQPLCPLLQWWQKQGRPIEVVSEFEFLAALKEGFAPERILLNGPAKHHWLPRHAQRGLSVNFDSVAEARALGPLARELGWRCGVRLQTREEFDPEAPEFPTQFGMTEVEATAALAMLKREEARTEIVHFHLRTNVPSAAIYERALTHAAEICRAASFAPKFIDTGGGFPPDHVFARDGKPVAAKFSLCELAGVYQRALSLFPSAQELWLENGRWLSARSGVLVAKVLDAKTRRGRRSLICDGGRTMNALISTWETHEILTVPERRGPTCLTTVNGPTCMAFDQLARRQLPGSVRVGDHLVWLDAGAYHLPWETRFSHGLAAVYWHDGRRTKLVRAPETFAQWWNQWR